MIPERLLQYLSDVGIADLRYFSQELVVFLTHFLVKAFYVHAVIEGLLVDHFVENHA